LGGHCRGEGAAADLAPPGALRVVCPEGTLIGVGLVWRGAGLVVDCR
jgi:hypothetical protein